jgi:hypothetical protein
MPLERPSGRKRWGQPVGSLYLKGGRLWARYKKAGGKWGGAPTPYLPGDEKKARQFLAVLEADTRVVASAAPPKRLGTPTVKQYAEGWIKDRRALGLRTADDDDTRLKLHVLPTIGEMAIDEVRPRHIRDLVLAMRKDGALAPRSIRNVYGVLATMFRTAVADELIVATPCVLSRGILPKKVDKDPAWRATAIFTRPEVEQLISDVRIPEDRRVLYALKGIAGLAHRRRDSAVASVRRDPGAAGRAQPGEDEDRRSPSHPGSPNARAPARRVEALGLGAHLRAEPRCGRHHRPDAEPDRASEPRLPALAGARSRHAETSSPSRPRPTAHVRHARSGRRCAPRSLGDDHARAARRHHQRVLVFPLARALRGGHKAQDRRARRAGDRGRVCYRVCYQTGKCA